MEKLALALVLASATFGCDLYFEDAPSEPDGSGAIVSDPDRLIGTWQGEGRTFEFTATGYLLIAGDGQRDSVDVLRASVAFGRPDRLVFTDDRCGAELGTYHWQIIRGTLTFEVVTDECAGRQDVLAGVLTDRQRDEFAMPADHALSSLDLQPWFSVGVAASGATDCTDCSERTVLSAFRRRGRWLVTERIAAHSAGSAVETCEITTDHALSPMRSFDPRDQLSSRSVVVESDCAAEVGTAADRAWSLDTRTGDLRTWSLADGFVMPGDPSAVRAFASSLRRPSASRSTSVAR